MSMSRNGAEDEAIPLFEDEEGLFGDEDEDSEVEEGSVKVAREDIKLMNVVRAIIILFLLTVATIFADTVFIITLTGEEDDFENSFAKTSETLKTAFFGGLNNDLWVARSMAVDLGLSATQSGGTWPNITYQNFEARSQGPLYLSDASSIAFGPIVSASLRPGWEAYATQAFVQGTPMPPPDGVTYFSSERSVGHGIYRFIQGQAQDEQDTDPLIPIWQLSPFQGTTETGLIGTLFNEQSNQVRSQANQAMLKVQGPIMTEFQYLNTNNTDFASYATPRGTVYYPIMNNGSAWVAGSLAFEYAWEKMLSDLVDEKNPIYVVVENKCGAINHTFTVIGPATEYLGVGDLHNDDVDGYSPTSSTYDQFNEIFEALQRYPSSAYDCPYRLLMFASSDYKDEYVTNQPEIYRGIVLAIFLFVVGVFVVYDCMIERRQKRVVAAAARSDAIVRSLFPANIRDRLYEQAKDKEDKAKLEEKNAKASSAWKAKPVNSGTVGDGAVIETSKTRLRNFVANASVDDDQLSASTPVSNDRHQDPSGKAPIADLFPDTTVMFGDIAGFTAWSSEREPAQVFTLLETIFRHMDHAAKKLGVFKVETVGDCYVAATGIPDPIFNHAEIMVRFARSCLLKVDLLTKELESQLGPGTAELCMRFGIHSGPVTAGVLRGQKARFQLFGDTMNTASRMESTGMKNKIQISGSTADHLTKAGFGHWITKRQDLVHVKGKGDMQTYWLLIGSTSLSVTSGVSDTANLESLIAPKSNRRKSKPKSKGGNVYANTGLFGILGVTEIDEPLQRLIDWNVDVLLTLLKRVIANRIASGQGTKALSSAGEKEIIGSGRLVLDDVCMVIEFPSFDAEIAKRAAEEEVDLIPAVKKELVDFIAGVASGYKRVAFHNFEHASHVILSANKLLKRIMSADDIATNEKEALTSKKLHEFTYGIGTDPITHFAIVFSALVHDVGHQGVPNFQLAKEDPELARKYVNKSLAEQRSVDIVWELLLLPRFSNLRACIYQDKVECRHFRDLVVNSVMATDIFDKELKALRESRWDMAFHGEGASEIAKTKEDMDRKATIVIEHIIQASDVSHTMQHWYIYCKWNERLFREVYFAFLMGRGPKDPFQGWFEGELWFFDNYVIPLARKLKECRVFGISSDEYLTYALQNRVEWEKKGKGICEKFKERADAEFKEMELHNVADTLEEEESATADNKPNGDGQSGTNDVEPKKAEVKEADAKEAAITMSAGANGTRTVIVPPGKLGIVIDTTDEGPVVYKINEDSSLKGKLNEGDIIISIDGVLTEGLDNGALSELIAGGQSNTRRFIINRKLPTIAE